MIVGGSDAVSTTISQLIENYNIGQINFLDISAIKKEVDPFNCMADFIIVDLSTSNKSLGDLLKYVKVMYPDSTIITLHYFQSLRIQEKVLKSGADYYVPFEDLEPRLNEILELTT